MCSYEMNAVGAGVEVVCVPRRPCSFCSSGLRRRRVWKESRMCVFINLYTCTHKYLQLIHTRLLAVLSVYIYIYAAYIYIYVCVCMLAL